MEGLLLEQVDRVLEEVSAPVFVAELVAGHQAQSLMVMPPCATSYVLPDQYVTMEIFDAGMRLCTSINSRGEATKIW